MLTHDTPFRITGKAAQPRRLAREPVVPMINVVFLLLIFFLMTARIAPPDPFEMVLPEASGAEQASEGQPLSMSRTGALAFGDLRGDAAIAAAVAASGSLLVQAHAQADATDLANLLQRLGAAGVTNIALMTIRASDAHD